MSQPHGNSDAKGFGRVPNGLFVLSYNVIEVIPMCYEVLNKNNIHQTHQFIIQVGYMFRPLLGHHQAFLLNHVIKTLRTLLGSQLMFTKYEMMSCLTNLMQIRMS